MARSDLASLFGADGTPHRDDIGRLLTACQKHSRPVKPKLLGIIGRDHLLTCSRAVGATEESFKYQKAVGEIDGLPWGRRDCIRLLPKRSRPASDRRRRQFLRRHRKSVQIVPAIWWRRFGGSSERAARRRNRADRLRHPLQLPEDRFRRPREIGTDHSQRATRPSTLLRKLANVVGLPAHDENAETHTLTSATRY